MTITGNTRVFLILGDPIAQVQAPQLYNTLFRQHGVDAVLVPAQVAPADFKAFAAMALKARNIDGLWLTIPHKTPMMDLLDRCDRLGTAAGAVNAARRNADGSVEGGLFDGVGLVKALDHFGIAVSGQRILLVGVGGAGVAIAASLAERGAGDLQLFDPTPGRAAAAAARVAQAFGTPAAAARSSDPAGFDLVINASPLGLNADDPLPFDVARLDADAAVVDILMKQLSTPLLRACRARGITAHAGHEMLVQQTPEYLSFFGYPEIAQTVQADPSAVRALLLSN
jgi:shikimate dehydrogenase